MQEPISITLGTSYKYKATGIHRSLIEKADTFQYVPFLGNLEWLLQNRSIYNAVSILNYFNPQTVMVCCISWKVFQDRPPCADGFLYDFCDGEIYKQHPLFSTDKQALQIIMYFDEVETTNPLGSYRGVHKLGMYIFIHFTLLHDLSFCLFCLWWPFTIVCFTNHSYFYAGLFYYFIGNIHPKMRSSVRCTQLIACVTIPNLNKYGFQSVLRPFIEDVNKLREVCAVRY